MAFEPLPIHELADLLPEMPDHELKELAGDIRINGFWGAIITHEGKVLDGRMRQKACAIAGVTPAYEEWDGQGGSPTAFVISANIHRRHLTVTQKALVAHNALPYLEAEAAARKAATQAKPGEKVGERKVTRPGVEPSETAEKRKNRESATQAGKLVGVSGDTVRRVNKVMEKGSPELQKALVEEKVSVKKAAELADRSFEEQVEATQKAETAPTRTGADPKKAEVQLTRSIPKSARQAVDAEWSEEKFVEENRKAYRREVQMRKESRRRGRGE